MNYEHIRVEPVAAALGAEVFGIDLSQPMDPATEKELSQAWAEHQVLFFRDQPITVEQQKAFARHFGELHIHPVLQQMADQGHPEVMVLESDADRPFVAERWHSDVTFQKQPPLGSILYAVAVPEAVRSSTSCTSTSVDQSSRVASAGGRTRSRCGTTAAPSTAWCRTTWRPTGAWSASPSPLVPATASRRMRRALRRLRRSRRCPSACG